MRHINHNELRVSSDFGVGWRTRQAVRMFLWVVRTRHEELWRLFGPVDDRITPIYYTSKEAVQLK